MSRRLKANLPRGNTIGFERNHTATNTRTNNCTKHDHNSELNATHQSLVTLKNRNGLAKLP